MKKVLLVLALVTATVYTYGQSKFEVQIKKTGTEDGIDVSSDDAEQENDEMDKLYDDDLDAGWEGDDFNTLSTGLRFTGITIPQGATIDSAYIEVYAHEDEEDEAIVTIKAEATDNASTFDLDNLITDRTMGEASVTWNVTEKWTMWKKYRTADISAVVQEVVNRDGWKSGNAMAIILMGGDSQGASDLDNARDMESFENEEDPEDGGDGKNHPERAPKLIVYYSGTSVNALEQEEVSVYPNPVVNGQLTVSLDTEKDFNASIVSLDGKELINTVAQSGQTLDVAALKPGMYLLKLENEDFTATKSIIIQ